MRSGLQSVEGIDLESIEARVADCRKPLERNHHEQAFSQSIPRERGR
jgi:hypothetical protein